MKNKKIFYLLLVIITISGCSEKHNYLYYTVVQRGFHSPDSPPLILSFHNGKKDTITCCVSGYELYYNWNLKAIDEFAFREILYETILSERILEVNEEFFNYLKEWCLVKAGDPIEIEKVNKNETTSITFENYARKALGLKPRSYIYYPNPQQK